MAGCVSMGASCAICTSMRSRNLPSRNIPGITSSCCKPFRRTRPSGRLMRAAVFLHPRIDEANAEPAEAAYPLASRRGLSQDRWLFGPPLAGRGCRGRSSRCAGPDSEDKQASHKRKRMLATSPVASGMKPTSSIADTSPGHNQKEEERQKCKGDGYDHFCSGARQVTSTYVCQIKKPMRHKVHIYAMVQL